ncbi:MAG: TrmB family transcriptional regulator [Acidiferrobacterales bacterium]
MAIKQALIDIGLTDKEAAAYLTLLRFGTRPTSYVAHKAGLNRGTAYVALHSLLAKGLIAKTNKRKVQYFTALEPTHLIDFLERREWEIRRNREKVQTFMGQLMMLTGPLTAKPRIELFEGIEAARTALEDTLTAKEKTLRAFLSISDIGEFLGPEFFDQYTTRRARAGYELHAIRTLEKDKEAMSKSRHAKRLVSSKKEKRIVRHVSEELAFPMTMYMYDDKVTVISSKEEEFALIIQSREFSEMQKKLFLLIWKSLEEDPPSSVLEISSGKTHARSGSSS